MELLVWLVDKGAAEDCYKRGDVIETQPDGWVWSSAELTNPDWLIIVVNSLLDTDRRSMQAVPDLNKLPRGRFRRRDWFIDFSKLPLPNRFAHPRTQAKVNMTRLGFIVALTQKPALV
jgi:hypothetical protein